MASGSYRPATIAVLDVGKTNVKLLAITPDGAILSSRQAPNAVLSGEPYPHCDTEHLWRWIMAALADLGERFSTLVIVPSWCCRSATTRPIRLRTCVTSPRR
jgi:sugar (pentulose or hexulose) kinase